MLVGVELFTLGAKALQAVLGKGLHENVLRHLEAVVEVNQVLGGLVLGGELLGGHHGQGAVQVVDALDEVLGEALDGVFSGCLDFSLGAVLEVAEVGNGAHALVLWA